MNSSILLVGVFTVLLSGCKHAVSDRAGLPSTTPSHVVNTAILPAPTATASLSATPTLPTPTPTITLTSTPTFTLTPTPHPMYILAMRAGIYPGSDIVIEKELEPGANYHRYYAYYLSEGLKIYALLTVPDGEMPAGVGMRLSSTTDIFHRKFTGPPNAISAMWIHWRVTDIL